MELLAYYQKACFCLIIFLVFSSFSPVLAQSTKVAVLSSYSAEQLENIGVGTKAATVSVESEEENKKEKTIKYQTKISSIKTGDKYKVTFNIYFPKDVINCEEISCSYAEKTILYEHLPFEVENLQGDASFTKAVVGNRDIIFFVSVDSKVAESIDYKLKINWKKELVYEDSLEPIQLDLEGYRNTLALINDEMEAECSKSEQVYCNYELNNVLLSAENVLNDSLKMEIILDSLKPKTLFQTAYSDYLNFVLEFEKDVSLKDVQKNLEYYDYAKKQYISIKETEISLAEDTAKNKASIAKYNKGLGNKFVFNLPVANYENVRIRVKKELNLPDTKITMPNYVIFEMVALNNLKVSETHFGNKAIYPWNSYASLVFNDILLEADLKKQIVLEPNIPFKILTFNETYGNGSTQLIIEADFPLDKKTKITFKKGFKSANKVLKEDYVYEVSGKTNFKEVVFAKDGRYLTPNNDMFIRIGSKNVEKIRLQAWELPENNIPAILNLQDYSENVRNKITLQFSKEIFNQITNVESLNNQTTENLIDLKEILPKTTAPGCYLLRIYKEGDEYYDRPDSQYAYSDYYYNSKRYLPIVITDLGVSARELNGEYLVWVNSLSTAKSVADVEVFAYDSANQIISKGMTDKNGLIKITLNGQKMSFLMVKKDNDLSYLTFGPNTNNSNDDYYYDDYHYDDYEDYYSDDSKYYSNDSYYSSQENSNIRSTKWYGGYTDKLNVQKPELKANRDYIIGGYEAFTFLPRDIYKPGEEVKIKGIIRDGKLNSPEKTFPVIWKIYDPEDNVFSQGQEEISNFGGFDFNTQLPFSARSGEYKIKIFLPEFNTAISYATFSVEDFMPPRLAIEANFTKDKYYGEFSEFEVNVNSKYLFGALASSLNYEVDFILEEEKINFKEFKDYNFDDITAKFTSFRDRQIISDSLDESGTAFFAYQMPIEDKLPPKLKADFLIKVQEDGGRWNAKRISTNYYANEFVLGLKKPETIKANKKDDWFVAVADVNGKTYNNLTAAKYEIYKVNKRNYYEYRYRSYSVQREVDESFLVASDRITLKNGYGSFSYLPEQEGFYIIVLSDESGKVSLTQDFVIYGEGHIEGMQVVDKVELNFDKPHYSPGETALVKVKAPFSGELLLTVENSKVIYNKVVTLKNSEEILEIPVTEDYLIQSYVTATVIKTQTVDNHKVRAIGIAPIYLNKELKQITIKTQVPEKIRPSEKLPLKIKLTDYEKNPVEAEVAIFLVDEGILSLTNFKTPNPEAFFYANRIYKTLFYDFYDRLLPFENKNVKFLKPGGDDEASGDLFSAFKRNQELLSIFVATVTTNANGEAEINLDLPEYSGNGRLMLVAYNDKKIGNYNVNLNISRDLTVEVTTPLAVAPGDKFNFPIKIFLAENALEQSGKNIKINIKTEGSIILNGKSELELNLNLGDSYLQSFEAVATNKNKDANAVGISKIIVDTVSGNGENFSQTFEVAVRSAFPRMVKSESAYIDKMLDIKVFDDSFLPGSFKSSLTIANDSLIEAGKAVRYLYDYPYGCLEQTTSRSWVFLAADELLKTLELGEEGKFGEDYIKEGILEASKRLSVMQTYSGGFAYWPNQNSVHEWGTIYATHFLTLASKKITLPEGLLENAVSWTEKYLNNKSYSDSSYSISTKAYAVYVLALNGKFNNAWVASLQNRDDLEASGRIYLAGAQALSEGNSNALLKLENLKVRSNYKYERYTTFESSSRNNALMLMVWVDVDPMSENARKWALKVSEDGKKDRWTNTQENGVAILALGTFMTKTGMNQEAVVEILNKKKKTLVEMNTKTNKSLNSYKMAQFKGEELSLKVDPKSTVKPYYIYTTWGVPKNAPTVESSGLDLKRVWILPNGSRVPLNAIEDFKRLPEINKGDIIQVEIKVKPFDNINNLVILDLLAGGFEIENPSLLPPADESEDGSSDVENDSSGNNSNLRVEAREDRMVIVAPWLEADKNLIYTYTYTLRAITPGEYVVPPTVVEGMYDPTQKGVLASGSVKIKDVEF